MLAYHFVNREYGLDDLRKQHLKIATLNDLNDPFELFCLDFSNPELRHAFRRTKEELAASKGLLCFSKDWGNPVQWSHYADKHQGICLGFEVPDNMLLNVEYVSRRLVAEAEAIIENGHANVALMKRFLSTKYSHWRYEKEVRCFLELDAPESSGLYFAEFSPALQLRTVIVGAASTITRAELTDALGDLAHDTTRMKGRLSFRTFRIVRQREESLWV